MKLYQTRAEIRLAGIEISDGPNNQRVLRGNIQHPLVIFEPGTAFHHNCPHNPEPSRDLSIPAGQRRAVKNPVVLWGPRHALRPSRVEQMDVRVNNWHEVRRFGRSHRYHA